MRSGAAERVLVVALLGAGGGLMLMASAPVWIQAQIRSAPGLPSVLVTVSGRTGAPLVPAVGLLALAGGVAAFLAGAWVRRVVGVLVGIGAAGALVGVIRVVRDPVASARGATADVVGLGGDPVVASAATTFWPLVAAVGCSLVVVGGAWLTLRAGAWGRAGRRFERPAPAPASPEAPADGSPDAGAAQSSGPVDLWDALDRGEDPTR